MHPPGEWCGFVNHHKPPGVSSQQAVSWVRRLFGAAKAGHTGTLDPLATGVLPICLGRATRLAAYVSAANKSYRAEVAFGVETDTLDAQGACVREADAALVTSGMIEETLPRFRGEIEQTPPAFSALSQQGQRLYRLARRGEQVVATPRQVTISELDLLEFVQGHQPRATLELTCGKGTYVRSLAADLAHALGTVGHLTALVRTRVGPFRIEDSLTSERLQVLADEHQLGQALLPPDYPLHSYAELSLGDGDADRFMHGGQVICDITPGFARIYDSGHRFLGVGRVSPEGAGFLLQPVVVLAGD